MILLPQKAMEIQHVSKESYQFVQKHHRKYPIQMYSSSVRQMLCPRQQEIVELWTQPSQSHKTNLHLKPPPPTKITFHVYFFLSWESSQHSQRPLTSHHSLFSPLQLSTKYKLLKTGISRFKDILFPPLSDSQTDQSINRDAFPDLPIYLAAAHSILLICFFSVAVTL